MGCSNNSGVLEENGGNGSKTKWTGSKYLVVIEQKYSAVDVRKKGIENESRSLGQNHLFWGRW